MTHAVGVLTEEDLPALARLLGRCLIHDELPPGLLRDRLFADPEQRPEHRLCVRAHDDALAGVAVGVVRARPDGPVGYVRLVATHPDHRGRGIATALLDSLEARLAAAGATRLAVGAELPCWLLVGVDVRYSAALCLFQRRGYTRTRDVFNLEVDLTRVEFDSGPVEAALAGHGISVARMAPADRAELDAYLSANWNQTWRLEGLAALDADPPSGFVARQRRDGRDAIVGFAVNDVARPGWFGPIGTDEALRGLGVGTALLLRCMRAWQEAGRTRGEINWIGPLRFYVRAVDATVCRVIWQMGKEVG
jgi:ribosomal protein S18 acetylase RimI-like enzyme